MSSVSVTIYNPDTTAPSVPTGLTATGGTQQVSLSCSASSDPSVSGAATSGLAGYKWYVATTPTGTYSLLATTASPSYTHTGLGDTATRYYKVAAYDNAGNQSAQTSYVVATTATPNLAPTFTVAPTAATIPATGGTIQFTATDPNADTLTYTLPTTRTGITINSGTGLVTVASSAAGTTGSITVRATDPSGAYAEANCAVTVQSASTGTPLFFDDFDYDLPRVQAAATKRATLATQGYTFYKDENYSTGSNGYLYTATSVPGYGGALPGTGPRTMVFESRGGTEGQTDYYLQLGNGATVTDPASASLPPNVWFQFWMYLAPGNAPSGKWLYALPAASGTRTDFPGSVDEMPWLLTVSGNTFEPSGALNSAPTAGWYTFNNECYRADRTTWPNDTQWKVGPNLVSGDDRWLRPGVWYLHKMHFDTSGTNGAWEWWTRAMGTLTWTKMAEYIGGTTANFTWVTQASERYGFRYLRMPTTNSNDSFQYLRDFAIASSDGDLPVYGSY